MIRQAYFSQDKSHRYSLFRRWADDETAPLLWILLNPSTADEKIDDPTIRRCIRFSVGFGFSAMRLLNIFAWRSTDPAGLFATDDPVGPLNDATILDCATSAPLIVCAWGVHGDNWGRANAVLELLRPHAAKLRCLGTTKSGAPKHPLYLAADTPLEDFPAKMRS